MKQGGKHSSWGFTIVETLIVLAVTTGIFVITAELISGKQDKAQFTTAINNTVQQIQQIISETSSGFFPNNANFKCTINVATNQPIISTLSGAAQGSNQGCIFLGKFLQFGVSNPSGQRIAVYPIAGNRLGTTILGSFNSSIPSGGAQPIPVVPLKTYDALQGNLTVGKMLYSTTSAAPTLATSAMGFLASDGDASGTFATLGANGFQSGSQQLSLYVAQSGASATVTSPANTESAMQTLLGATDAAHIVTATSVSICFISGTTSQIGLVTIGGDGGLAVTLRVQDGTTCP